MPGFSLRNIHLPRAVRLFRFILFDTRDSGKVKRNSVGTIQRRYSSPILTSFELSFADPRVYVPLRKLSPIPPTPSTPNIEPRRLPSIVEPDKSSWRLSFASANRGEQLRRLSKEHAPAVPLIPDLLNTKSPPRRKWLHNQGLRSFSREIQDLDICSRQETCHSHDDPETREFGGVDGPDDDLGSGSQHQADKATTLVSQNHRGSNLSLAVSDWASGEFQDPDSSGSQAVMRTHDRRLQNTSESIPLSQRLPTSWGRKKTEEDQRHPPSTTSSFQQPPKNSRFRLIHRLSGKKEKTKLKATLESFSVTRLSSDATFHTAADDTSIPSTPYPRRSTIDDSSILASETESFREREAELKVVQARFASADAQRSPSTPRSSKFREEFDYSSPSATFTEPRERKISAFARLTRFATRTFDGASVMEDLLAVPMPKFDVNEIPDRTPGISLLANSDVSAQWGKAIKLATDEKAEDVDNHPPFPTGRGKASREGSSFGWNKKETDQKIEEEPLTSAAQYEKQFQERLLVKEMVMDDWEAEMEATAQKAKANSRNIMKKIKAPTGLDKRFPISWSRFPSHSRSERSLSAGASDLVGQHDFAMRSSESGERVFHQCRVTPDDRHIHDDNPEWHNYDREEIGLAAKIGDKISQTVYHLEVHRGGSKPFEFQTDGRRGSMVLATKMEFPELELLPVSPGIPDIQEDPFEVGTDQDEAEKKRIVNKLAEYGKEVDNFDGKFDDSRLEESVLCIADPRFYDDCLIHPTDEHPVMSFADTLRDMDTPASTHNMSRSKTWHGREINGRKLDRRRNWSVGTMILRASTDEYYDELVRMEKAELEKFPRSTELAWDGNN